MRVRLYLTQEHSLILYDFMKISTTEEIDNVLKEIVGAVSTNVNIFDKNIAMKIRTRN